MAAITGVGADPATSSEEIPPAATQRATAAGATLVPPAAPPDVMAARTAYRWPPRTDEIEFSWVRQTARRVGTVVHEALEDSAAARRCREELPRCARALNRDLQALGVDGRQRAPAPNAR